MEQEMRRSERHVDCSEAAHSRLMELAARKDRLPPERRGLLEEGLETASAVVEELHHTAEELRAARDEIRRRADELLETRDRWHGQLDQ